MEHLAPFTTWAGIVSLLTLALMEIVLGIDNIVFITIITGKLPQGQRLKAQRTGLALALGTRVLLLLALSWLMALTAPLVSPFGKELSGRDLILLAGGLFLIFKAVKEIHEKLEGAPHTPKAASGRNRYLAVLLQIAILDIVFSLDSVITAIGMAQHVPIMVAAMTIAMLVMLLAMNSVGAFVERHPTIKMLALSFLLLIGVMLVAEGWGSRIEKGYIYFAMAFSLFVEMLNIRLRKKAPPVKLHEP